MSSFDGNDYRKRVMARLAADFSEADPETGDPFFVLDLDPATASDADVRERLSDVVAFWQKERNSPKYKGIAASLVEARSRYEAVLTDPARRSAAANRVISARSASEATRFANLDRLAKQLSELHGGLPASKVDQLRLLSRRNGVDDAAFAGWLARQKVLADDGAAAKPWESSIRRQIRSQLDELARGAQNRARYATLWTFLDLSPNCSDAELAARHAELLAENQRGRHDASKTRNGELLAHIKTRLMAEGGRAAYLASLRADARDYVEPDVAEKAIVAGEVTASDYELLVQRVVGLGWGISTGDAREAVRAAATDLGASLAVAPAVEYIVCAQCRTTQPQPPNPAGALCRYCGAPLYAPCPACNAVIEVAAVTCPRCGTSLKTHREAAELLHRGRDQLSAGNPRAARESVAAARVKLGQSQPPARLSELAAAVDSALATAATEWTALESDIAGRRIWAAYDRVTRLARTAADVAGPGGITPQAKLIELADAKAAAQEQVRAVTRLEPAEAELALSRVLTEVVDCPEAIAALAAIPLAPPRDLVTRVGTDGIEISWRPSPARGNLSYRVVRQVTMSDGPASSSNIGTTSATQLEDAGAPGGALIRYEISAVSGRRASLPLVSDELFVERDVAAVRAEASDDGVNLRWSVAAGGGLVVIERGLLAPDQSGASDDAPALAGPTRRIRPAEPGSYLDADVLPGNSYHYKVYVEYRRPGAGTVRTPGRSAVARVVARPAPVTDLWAVTDKGRTTLSFAIPANGQVAIYATAGPHARALGQSGQTLRPDAVQTLAVQAGARLAGTGRRRVIDTLAAGRVVYTPVTLGEGGAVIGTALEHLAIGRIENLTAIDQGSSVLVTFELPTGITEAYIGWRPDAAPTSPADPRAASTKVTNMRLEIDGGFRIDGPDDGRGLWVAAWPAVRAPGSNQPVPGPHAASVIARQPRAVRVRYSVRRTGLMRRTLQISVDSYPDVLPEFTLVTRSGSTLPESPTAGSVLRTGGGSGSQSAELEVPLDDLPKEGCMVRLFVTGRTERPVIVDDPELKQLTVSR